MKTNLTERERILLYLMNAFNFTRKQANHLLSISNDRKTN
jgi:hypothetical protein